MSHVWKIQRTSSCCWLNAMKHRFNTIGKVHKLPRRKQWGGAKSEFPFIPFPSEWSNEPWRYIRIRVTPGRFNGVFLFLKSMEFCVSLFLLSYFLIKTVSRLYLTLRYWCMPVFPIPASNCLYLILSIPSTGQGNKYKLCKSWDNQESNPWLLPLYDV